jgi:hypothetical protein
VKRRGARLIVDLLFIASRPIDVAVMALRSIDWALYWLACVVDRWGGEPEDESTAPLTLAQWLCLDDVDEEE